jgi:hypothetical protein
LQADENARRKDKLVVKIQRMVPPDRKASASFLKKRSKKLFDEIALTPSNARQKWQKYWGCPRSGGAIALVGGTFRQC